MKTCEGGTQPEIERCNGFDDDCDGQIDVGVSPPGLCPPPGLKLGDPVRGECAPGTNTCSPDGLGGARWTCVGGVGPAVEVCDGKDNDCDGAIDNAARCPDDANTGCFDGTCVPRCSPGSACPEGHACKNGLCILAECARKPCKPGFFCDISRGCVDRCEGVTCTSPGFHCDNGVCTNCHVTGCVEGEVCRVDSCEKDPCFGIACEAGSYCRAGVCVPGCQDVKCAYGDSCRDGECRRDRCSSRPCPSGQVCNPDDGRCVQNLCHGIQCLAGQVCVPALAKCVADPCLLTRCDGDDVCVVETDGLSRCLTRQQIAATYVSRIAAGGAGCSCRVGAPGFRGPDQGIGWLVAAAWFVAANASRRRRRGPTGESTRGKVVR
jgi:hypothetical protein